MSTDLIRLGPLEIVKGRPFTNCEGSTEDMATLQYMAEKLCRLFRRRQVIPIRPCPFVLNLEETRGKSHRIALSRPEALLHPDDLTVVGFCGQKRPRVDRGPIDAVDEELIAEFSLYADLLSYSTLQMQDGNSCNLVLFSRPQGIMHWATSKKHAEAVYLAPAYYQSVRLHNATLPGGLFSENKLILLRTKYYDYRDKPVWRAIRELVNTG